MKKIIAGLLLVFSAFNLSGQQKSSLNTKDVSPQKIVYKKYTDAKEKVSINYPATWVKFPYSLSVFMFMRPVEEKGQRFKENINLVVGDAQDLYLIEYLLDSRTKMKDQMEGFKELKSEFIKINGLDFVRMIYEFRNGNLVLKSVLYLAVKNGKAYSLTGAALDSTFDRFYPLFQDMAKSFRIK